MENPEQDVLEPLAPAIKEATDLWPEFSLRDVRIVSQITGKTVSLLSAHTGHAVQVVGALQEVDVAHAHLVLSPSYQTIPLVISDVTTYSFSQWEDGTFGFWAGGKAGWYEIAEPAKEYRGLFEEMNEATGMFYFAADKFRKSKKVYSCANSRICEDRTKEWFNEYLGSEHCSRKNVEDVRRGFYYHRGFLMKSMLEGQENLPWDHSPILRNLKFQFPNEYNAIKSYISNSSTENGSEVTMALPASARATEKPKWAADASNFTVTSHGNSYQHHISLNISEDTAIDNSVFQNHLAPVCVPFSTSNEGTLNADQTKGNKSNETSLAYKGQAIPRPKEYKIAREVTDGRQGVDLKLPILEKDHAKARENGLHIDVCRPFQEVKSPWQPQNLTLKIYTSTSRFDCTVTNTQQISEIRNGDTPLPSYYEPLGPGDTWTCPYTGCNRRVWGARDVEGIILIEKHFVLQHAGKVIDLIHEKSRPWISRD